MKKLLPLIIGLFCITNTIVAQKDSTQMVSTWKTTNLGGSGVGDSSIYIHTDPNYTYNYDVDWNDDGIFDTLGLTQSIVHQYPDTGTYTVRIRGTFPRVFFRAKGTPFAESSLKLIAFEQWGTTVWSRLDGAFRVANNMQYNATDTPNLSGVTDLSFMFSANRINQFIGDISNWNVSHITNMEGLLDLCLLFNQDLSGWDVSQVTNMAKMFSYTTVNFNLNAWDVSAVTDMEAMFESSQYNQALNSWNVSSVTDMGVMFIRSQFNQPLDAWDVSAVMNMKGMFFTSQFNLPLDAWDVSAVTNMRFMFYKSLLFNQSISSWDVSS
ncbi:MAG: BspA family leucine-rich repeat surface protein, partial [Flavobacteriales bacterium]|nr:BspA family leucine-rich repeat surface protein [Flavobacteriales bacterium]